MVDVPPFKVEMSDKYKKREAYFRLEYYFSKDFVRLHELITESIKKFEANMEFISNHDSIFEDLYREKLLKNGFMRFLSGTIAMEDITSPSIPFDEIEVIFKRFVNGTNITNALIVIDPYFFAESKNYDIYDLFFRLVSPPPDTFKKMIIVHNGKVNQNTIKYFLAKFYNKYPEAELVRRKAGEFHDRFWINPTNKEGIVVGNSLSGIGRKISIVDKLSDTDTASVLAELNRLRIQF